MSKRAWRRVAAIGCAMAGLAMTAGDIHAQGYAAPVVVSGDDCDDDCGGCCRGLSFCNKLRMHCIYYSRKCYRPYRQLDHVPPELAPYVGPGTWNSPGYGLPYAGPQGAPYGYGGAPAARAPMGNAR